VCSSLGFTEPEARNQVRLYPNPFSGNVLWIENSDNDPITDVYIIDMKGSLVQHHQMNSINQNSLNADLNTGIYLVHVNTRNHNRTTHKLVVLK
ncbi:MAG: T9SS type A sorting domain-containing protein, partial [Sphingobacteriales bacterium]